MPAFEHSAIRVLFFRTSDPPGRTSASRSGRPCSGRLLRPGPGPGPALSLRGEPSSSSTRASPLRG
eukprot:988601-Alexandrium_andersonii.AAC.1